MRMAYHVMSSPVGLLFLARTERGLRLLQFMERKSLKRMIALNEETQLDASWEPSLLGLKSYVDQLDQYFCGDRMEFSLPLDPLGSPFQFVVWTALRVIPYGETRSYIQIARAISQPRAARAVGLANNQNPIAIIVPCHRVIGAGGDLVGYGGGLQRKKWLLDHEARFAEPVGRTGDLFRSESVGGVLIAARPVAARPAMARPVATRPAAGVSAPAHVMTAKSTRAGAAKTAAARVMPAKTAAAKPIALRPAARPVAPRAAGKSVPKNAPLRPVAGQAQLKGASVRPVAGRSQVARAVHSRAAAIKTPASGNVASRSVAARPAAARSAARGIAAPRAGVRRRRD